MSSWGNSDMSHLKELRVRFPNGYDYFFSWINSTSIPLPSIFAIMLLLWCYRYTKYIGFGKYFGLDSFKHLLPNCIGFFLTNLLKKIKNYYGIFNLSCNLFSFEILFNSLPWTIFSDKSAFSPSVYLMVTLFFTLALVLHMTY